MNVNTFNPDSWMDVVAILTLGVLGVITAGLPLWFTARKAANTAVATSAKVTEIHEQTVNDHCDQANLRVQLDRMEKRIEDIASQADDTSADVRGMRKDVGGLRGEIRDVATDTICRAWCRCRRVP